MNLLIKDCVHVGELLYCISRDFNLVFSYNLSSENIELLTSIPGECANETEVCGAIDFYEGKLLLLPNKTNHIWIYDLEGKKLSRIERKDLPHYGSGGMLQTVRNGRAIYIIGSSYPAMIRLDMENRDIKYITAPFEDVNKRIKNIDDAYFRTHHAIKENNIYMASCLDNYILRFSIIDESYEWLKVGRADQKYAGLDYDGKNFWMAPRKSGTIVAWDGKNRYEEILLPEGCIMRDYSYLSAVCFEDKVYIPNQCDAQSIEISSDGVKLIEKQIVFMKKTRGNEMIYQLADGEGWISCLGNNRKISLEFDAIALQDFFLKNNVVLFNNRDVIVESEIRSLDMFIKFVSCKSGEI